MSTIKKVQVASVDYDIEDANAVHKTGDETINGNKTFNDDIIIAGVGEVGKIYADGSVLNVESTLQALNLKIGNAGSLQINGSAGSDGQVLTSKGGNPPEWTNLVPTITFATNQVVVQPGTQGSSTYFTLSTNDTQRAILGNANFGIIKVDLSAFGSAVPVPYIWLKRNVGQALASKELIQFSFDNAGFIYDHALTDGYVYMNKIGNGGAIYESTTSKYLFVTYENFNPDNIVRNIENGSADRTIQKIGSGSFNFDNSRSGISGSQEGGASSYEAVSMNGNVKVSADHAFGCGLNNVNDAYGGYTEGNRNYTHGTYGHTEGQLNVALGKCSHAQGVGNVAQGDYQFVFGKFNEIPNNHDNYVEIVGNGSSSSYSNARTLDWDGNEWLAGKLTLGAGPVNNMDAATKLYVDGEVNDVREIASGKSKSYSIAAKSNITGTENATTGQWTNVTAITGITLSNLKVGDNIYVEALGTPDYWVSQVSPSVSLNILETKISTGRGINISSGNIGHSNAAITAITTNALKKISVDEYGHITNYTNVTASDIPGLSNKLDASKCTYQETAPSSAITDGGVHLVSLTSEPSTTYNGYIYFIKE